MSPAEYNGKEMRPEDVKSGKTQYEMKCEEAAEFVSALCDGERIPPAAAAHIGACTTCRACLREYAEMGAELRRLASLETVEDPRAPRWKKAKSTAPDWWQKGWETMRIPRFAFALLVMAVVALGSSLTIVKVRAHEQGRVLMLTARTATGRTIHFALDMEDKAAGRFKAVEIVKGASELYGFRFISKDGDRIQLGVRAKRGSDIGSSTDDVDNLPETLYRFHPGEKLEVNVDGSGPTLITGELLDHVPPALAMFGGQLDPDAGELRFAAPLLLRGKEVLNDFSFITVTGFGKNGGIQLCVPHDGRYEFSLSRLEGASEGQINESRIAFELNGQNYKLLAGAPIARAERIWVLYLPEETDEDCSNGYMPMSQYLPNGPLQN